MGLGHRERALMINKKNQLNPFKDLKTYWLMVWLILNIALCFQLPRSPTDVLNEPCKKLCLSDSVWLASSQSSLLDSFVQYPLRSNGLSSIHWKKCLQIDHAFYFIAVMDVLAFVLIRFAPIWLQLRFKFIEKLLFFLLVKLQNTVCPVILWRL